MMGSETSDAQFIYPRNYFSNIRGGARHHDHATVAGFFSKSKFASLHVTSPFSMALESSCGGSDAALLDWSAIMVPAPQYDVTFTIPDHPSSKPNALKGLQSFNINNIAVRTNSDD
jgi:hypothetical protein